MKHEESEVRKSEEEWRKQLTEEQYHVAREKGTERAFTGKYHDCKDPGTYRCVCCGAALFDSEHKYDSGSGWPSFTQPIDGTIIKLAEDRSHGMVRTEAVCARCNAHLGHVFDDGPAPGGARYCVNSASLELTNDKNASGEGSS